MKPIEPIPNNKTYQGTTLQVVEAVTADLGNKLNELIAAHNKLLAKYESHKHQYECEEGRRQTQAPRKDGS